ncbi:acylphosphatase isozyme Ch1 [Panus rudis PR-1116 ss-1]|nr:acylphosphatase isozyme Ch1 [Panus rudis PR-1116 ss-1]
MTLRSLRYVVSGGVQGVGFRKFLQRQANLYGIVGWVMNDPSGDVVGEAQGEDRVINRFKEDLARGPPAATVKDLKISEEREIPKLEFSEFEIRRPYRTGHHANTKVVS